MLGVSRGRLRLSDRCASRITRTCSYEEADRCYTRASSSWIRREWRWRYYRALIQAERGGGEPLVENLRRVVNQAPDFGPAWQRLGDALFKAGKYDEAREAWNARHGHDVGCESAGTASRHRGSAVRVRKRGTGADRARAGETIGAGAGDPGTRRHHAPQFSSALRLLADVYRSLGRGPTPTVSSTAPTDAALRAVLDPMVDDLARESRNSTLLLRVSSEANLAVNAEWAEYLTRRALEFDPDNPEAVVKLGRVLRTIGRNEEALEFFQRYHQMVRGYLGLAHIGSCLSAMGRYQEAESYLRRRLPGSMIRRRTTTSGCCCRSPTGPARRLLNTRKRSRAIRCTAMPG